MQRFRPLAAAAILAVLAFPAASQTRPFVMPDARLEALGGKHVAQPSGISLLFSNPAGFAAAPGEFIVTELSSRLSGPVFDIAQLFIDGDATEPAAIAGLLDPAGRLYTAADLGGPIAVGYVGKGLGVGFFNRSWAEVNAPSLTRVDLSVSEELLALSGYAFRLKPSPALALDLGVLLKVFQRFEIFYPTNILGLSGLLSSPASILESAGFRTTSGLGVDAGARFSILDRYAFAVSARDAFTPTFTAEFASFNAFSQDPAALFSPGTVRSVVPCDLSAGVYAKPPLGILDRYVTGVELMLDYGDILSLFGPLPPNPFLLVSAGAEVTMHDIFRIRGGWNQGAFAAGFGLGLTLFDLDIAIFGRELGADLGERTIYNLLVSFSVKVK